MSRVKRKIKKRQFATLTRIVSTQTNQRVFLYCTVLKIVVILIHYNSAVAQYCEHQARCTHCTLRLIFWYSLSLSLHYTWCLLDLLCSAHNSCKYIFTVSTGVWNATDFMWPHTKNIVALNPAIMETLQSGRLGLSISTQNFGQGDHEPQPAKRGAAPSCSNQRRRSMSNDTSSNNSPNTYFRKVR